MGLCLANSLIACSDFSPYDQLVRYKWWYEKGYMSSTGQCFDIGNATKDSLEEFLSRQKKFAASNDLTVEEMDKLSPDDSRLSTFDVYCSSNEVAGNGALMRLAPVPLFFFRNIFVAIEFSGRSGEITHGDPKARDACRYYGALIACALRGFTKKELLDRYFYAKHRRWFGEEPLHHDIVKIAEGSFQRKAGGHKDGIRGKGYIVDALEAALWSFWMTTTFEEGALAAVNLGDDTDTTAAIYGQLAGAFYGYKALPSKWVEQIYARTYLEKISVWIAHEGQRWEKKHR
jgi:ADP-ribosyl-[dinitrogen reductase] hydrolase